MNQIICCFSILATRTWSEGVEKKRKGPKAVCVGHCHAPVRLIVAQGGCWRETFIHFCVSFKIDPFIGIRNGGLMEASWETEVL